MPSIRDLKGRPVEEEVASPMRVGPAHVPDPPVTLPPAALAALRRITERPREGRERVQPEAEPVPFQRERIPEVAVPLPEDFDAGLRSLEGSLAVIVEQARLLAEAVEFAQGQTAALRVRAEMDAARLAKLNAALKTLTE